MFVRTDDEGGAHVFEARILRVQALGCASCQRLMPGVSHLKMQRDPSRGIRAADHAVPGEAVGARPQALGRVCLRCAAACGAVPGKRLTVWCIIWRLVVMLKKKLA